MLEHHQTPRKLVIKRIFLRSSILKRSKTNFNFRGDRELFFFVSTNYIDPLFSLRGERRKISIPPRRIQKHSNSWAQRIKTEQIDDKARVSWGNIAIKDWLASLSCSSSRATTEWSAIFAFGVSSFYSKHLSKPLILDKVYQTDAENALVLHVICMKYSLHYYSGWNFSPEMVFPIWRRTLQNFIFIRRHQVLSNQTMISKSNNN